MESKVDVIKSKILELYNQNGIVYADEVSSALGVSVNKVGIIMDFLHGEGKLKYLNQ